MLLAATNAFVQWGYSYGVETSFGIASEHSFSDSHSISLQRWDPSGLGISIDWIYLQQKEEKSEYSKFGLLGSAFWGFPLGSVFMPYIGGGLGFGYDMGNDSFLFSWKLDAGVVVWLFDSFYIKAGYTYNNIREHSISVGAGLKFGSTPPPQPQPAPQPRPTPQPVPAPQPAPAPRPTSNPTITSEELRRVELAYAETVRDIERRGKRLYIRNSAERSAFIRQYQGNPATESVRAARDRVLPYYNIRDVSQEDIVMLARREANDFDKVRLIHDWVSDIFSYDFDLLVWMDNVNRGNAEFTLGKIIERQRGVCFEYAILFWFLMDAAGIDTYLVSDHSQPGIGHAYNMVIINNTGYIIDTTWDSGNWYQSGRLTRFDRMIQKDYFMPSVSQSYRLRGW
jgi:transglutaminase-like putative cysteine protease